jgi:hypothetical protein
VVVVVVVETKLIVAATTTATKTIASQGKASATTALEENDEDDNVAAASLFACFLTESVVDDIVFNVGAMVCNSRDGMAWQNIKRRQNDAKKNENAELADDTTNTLFSFLQCRYEGAQKQSRKEEKRCVCILSV